MFINLYYFIWEMDLLENGFQNITNNIEVVNI